MKSLNKQLAAALKRSSRLYSAQPASNQKTVDRLKFSAEDFKVSKLPNGLTVVSLENCSPVAHVAITCFAGSRHEPTGQLGLTHCLRTASSLSTEKATAFGLARELQQKGATMSCSTTREHMIYTASCMRNELPLALQSLGHVVNSPAFKHWEVRDFIAPRVRLDLELVANDPGTMLIEAIHKAVFRDTLGNSLYMQPSRVGSISLDQMKAFVHHRYISGNMTVAGVGVDHETLKNLASRLNFKDVTTTCDTTKATYHGGDERIDVESDLVHAAMVTEGVSLTSDEMIPVAILQAALGSSLNVYCSSGPALSRINKAAAAATTDMFATGCINVNYTDSGLFGVQVVATPKNIRPVLKAVVGAMGQVTKSGITEEEFNWAKQQLKARVAFENENPKDCLEYIAFEALTFGKVFPLTEVSKALNAVTLDSVNKVAKRVITGRPSMAVVGDLVDTPYLDELL